MTCPTANLTSAKTRPAAPALAHWFNHQTHHRGQVHALVDRARRARRRNSICCISSGWRPSRPPEITKTSPPAAQGLGPSGFARRGECSKTVHPGPRPPINPPNILKERVLFTSSEFHFGPKHATTSCQGASAALAAAKFASGTPSWDRSSRSRCWKQYAGRSRFCATSKSCTSWVLPSASRSSGSRATCSTICSAASMSTRSSRPSRRPSPARSRWRRCSWPRAISR